MSGDGPKRKGYHKGDGSILPEDFEWIKQYSQIQTLGRVQTRKNSENEPPKLTKALGNLEDIPNPSGWVKLWPFWHEVNLSFLLDIEDPTQRCNAIEYELSRTRRELGKYPRYHLSESGNRLMREFDPLEGLGILKQWDYEGAQKNPGCVPSKIYPGWVYPDDFEHGFAPWGVLRDEQQRSWHGYRIQPPTCTREEVQGGFVQLGELLDSVAIADMNAKPAGDPYLRLKLIHDWIERITAGSWMPFGEFLASQDSGLKSSIPWAVEHPQALLIRIPSNSKRGDFLCTLETLAKAIPPERFIDGKPGQDPSEKGIIQALIVRRLEAAFGRKENVLAFQCLELQGLANWKHGFSGNPDGTPAQVREASKAVSKHRTRMDDLLKTGQFKAGEDVTEPFRTRRKE